MTQTQIQKSFYIEQHKATTCCLEIAETQIKLLYEYECLADHKDTPQSMYIGIQNRLDTNYILLYQTLTSYQKESFFKVLLRDLIIEIEKYKGQFKYQQLNSNFQSYIKKIRDLQMPEYIKFKGARYDEASVNYTMSLIAKGQNNIDKRQGEKYYIKPDDERKHSKSKIDEELYRLKSGIPSKYKHARQLYSEKIKRDLR